MIVLMPIVLIAVLFAYSKYLLSPLTEKKNLLNTELEKIKREFQESQARVARLPQLEKEIEQLNLELSKIEKKLPTNKDVPGLIRLLTKKMDSHRIIWSRLTPGNQTEKEYYTEHLYTIPFTTSYHQLALFFSEIGQMERIFATRFIRLVSVINARTQRQEVQGELQFLIYTSKG